MVAQVQAKPAPTPSFTPIRTNLLQRKCACGRSPGLDGGCTACRKKRLPLQRNATNQAGLTEVPTIVNDVLRLPGQPLDSGTRAFMAPRIGHDFSRVRVHSDARAAESARTVHAQAYTVGTHIVFNAGQYRPQRREGQRLLAHELTHVAQQPHLGSASVRQGLDIAADDNAFEQEARTVGATVAAGNVAPSVHRVAHEPILQRVSLGEQISRLLGGGAFSEEELQDYLRFLDQSNRIEDHFDSDNKAREVVKRWKRGDSLYLLPVRRKILLIQEMLSGFTGDDDEQAILDLLRGSSDLELSSVLSSVGQKNLRDNFHGEELIQLDQLLAARQATASGAQTSAEAESAEVFPAETVLQLQERFTSNAESTNRLNCILIIRELAPQLFAQDPELAQRIETELNLLTGQRLKMTEVGRVLSDLGLASNYAEIRFNNGNGVGEPTAIQRSAWDTIMAMVGTTPGWHIFGLAVFNGYHSVTVFVDNRPDDPRVYWADQWRIDPGEDFNQEPGSVSGFRRYEKTGFDAFIAEKTREWWNEVLAEKGKKYKASLHVWKFRSRLPDSGAP